jgi:TonB-linked SusC/RagA family outer membrane protein
MSEGYSENTNSTMDVSLNYERTFGTVHHFKGLLLYEKIDYNSNNLSGNRQFTIDALPQLSTGNTVMTITGNNDVNKTDRQSIVGRLNYDYASKYLVEFSFRDDGSSLFPQGKQWGFFPNVSLGWRLSEEDFIKNNLPFVSNLKLRGSWGKMGDDGAAAFQYIAGYNYPSGGYVFNGVYTAGLSSRGMTNPNITWYTSTTSDVGIDANLWNQNLNFTFDAFVRKRTGLLASLALNLPQTVGASLPQMNLNSDLNRGFDFSIGTNQNINGFQFGVNAQFSYYYNENLYQSRAPSGNSYLNWTSNQNDRISNIIWGYKLEGHFTSQAQINAAAIEDGQGNKYVKIGDLQFVDVNHDGVINNLDMVPLATGNQYPEISYGVNFTFAWKGFDASALFQGGANVYVNLRGTDQLANPFPWGRNGLSQFMNVWHQADPTNPNSAWISGTYYPSRISGVNPNNLTSFYFVKNDSYLRLKNVEIGYTIPDQLIKKIGFQKLRVFANGFNVLTWDNIPYMDPEHPSSTYGYLYPITRNFNVGLEVTF